MMLVNLQNGNGISNLSEANFAMSVYCVMHHVRWQMSPTPFLLVFLRCVHLAVVCIRHMADMFQGSFDKLNGH